MLPYAFLVRGRELFYGELQVYTEGGLLFNLVDSCFSNELGRSIFSVLLIFLQAWVISHFVNRNKLTRDANLIAGIFYILFVSFLPEYNGLSPILLANTFLILAYGSLSNIYRKPKSEIYLFNSGAYIAIASLFYFPYVVFIALGFMGIYILNTFKVINILQFVSGFIVPFFLSATYLIYQGNTELVGTLSMNLNFQMADWFSQGRYGSYILAVTAIFITIVIFSYNGFMVKKSIQVQKKVDMIYWILFLALASTILFGKFEFYQIQITALPLAILLSLGFMRIRNWGLTELLHLVLLTMLFTLHFSLHLLLGKG